GLDFFQAFEQGSISAGLVLFDFGEGGPVPSPAHNGYFAKTLRGGGSDGLPHVSLTEQGFAAFGLPGSSFVVAESGHHFQYFGKNPVSGGGAFDHGFPPAFGVRETSQTGDAAERIEQQKRIFRRIVGGK